MNVLDSLIHSLSRLPGVGKKSAMRLAYHLLKADETYVQGLVSGITTVRERIRPCTLCGAYTEESICPVCSDPRRNKGLICVVEQPQDVDVMESSLEFDGLYHVLNGVLAPLDGVGPEDLTIGKLVRRVEEGQITEIILATNPTIEGDTTALYIKKIFEQKPVEVSRLALGLPVGGDLEYADRLTLARSLRGRTRL
jgi:recombination protein RecR